MRSTLISGPQDQTCLVDGQRPKKLAIFCWKICGNLGNLVGNKAKQFKILKAVHTGCNIPHTPCTSLHFPAHFATALCRAEMQQRLMWHLAMMGLGLYAIKMAISCEQRRQKDRSTIKLHGNKKFKIMIRLESWNLITPDQFRMWSVVVQEQFNHWFHHTQYISNTNMRAQVYKKRQQN